MVTQRFMLLVNAVEKALDARNEVNVGAVPK
jgi:hypothetical protein